MDEFVSAAREFYVNSRVLPRKQFNVKTEPVSATSINIRTSLRTYHESESLLTAHFVQGDLSYDWVLEYLVR